jgi:1-acyl-sn-glycerol-3-phosphate acyltransferase
MSHPQHLSFGFRVIQKLTRLLLHILTQLDVDGIERLPEQGPAILCPNHVAWTDAVVVLAYVRGTTTAFAADKWEKRFPINLLMRYFGRAIFVHRGEVDRQALGKALEVLKQGGILGVAPEGTRSYSGVLAKGHDGAVYLASRTDACLVPIAISGHESAMSEWKKLRRPRIVFRVGEPFHLPSEARRARASELPAYTDSLMRRIAAMLPPERRGPYA